jgi:hypothetical protein
MVRDLPTYFGRLSYRMRREGPDTLRVALSGDLVIPPGRILLMPPLPRPLVAAEVNGRSSDLLQPDGFACGECPADILLRY